MNNDPLYLTQDLLSSIHSLQDHAHNLKNLVMKTLLNFYLQNSSALSMLSPDIQLCISCGCLFHLDASCSSASTCGKLVTIFLGSTFHDLCLVFSSRYCSNENTRSPSWASPPYFIQVLKSCWPYSPKSKFCKSEICPHPTISTVTTLSQDTTTCYQDCSVLSKCVSQWLLLISSVNSFIL